MKTKRKIQPATKPDGAILRDIRNKLHLLRLGHERMANARLISLALTAFRGYPITARLIRFEAKKHPERNGAAAMLELNRMHGYATKVLVNFAGKCGIDATPIEVSSVLCQRVSVSMDTIRTAAYWPECLDQMNVNLSPSELESIALGEARLDQLQRELECGFVSLPNGVTIPKSALERPRAAAPDYTKPMLPTKCARLYGVSLKTLKRMHKRGEAEIYIVSSKAWCLRIDKLPPNERKKYQP
jgi:hypothetical protein